LGALGLGFGAGLARDDGAELLRAAPAAEVPPATLIDTHTHFYDPTRPEGVPWPPATDPLLYRTVLPADYQARPTPAPVTGTVVVEASPWVEDNQWVLDLAAREPFIVGLVGHLPIGTAEFPDLLERFAAHRLFRGLRLRGVPWSTVASAPLAIDHLRLLADRDLCLDVVGGPELLAPVVDLARQVPSLRIVIDHLAGVRVDGQAPPVDWQRAFRRAAECPKVYCKVSGLVEGTGKSDGGAPGATEYYRPVLDCVWEWFGPDRLIYGSNWPVSERFASLATVQRIVAEYFSSRGRVAAEKVFWRNAGAAYRWVRRTA